MSKMEDLNRDQSGDPHSAVYISNPVDLKNPATSLKSFINCILDMHQQISEYCIN